MHCRYTAPAKEVPLPSVTDPTPRFSWDFAKSAPVFAVLANCFAKRSRNCTARRRSGRFATLFPIVVALRGPDVRTALVMFSGAGAGERSIEGGNLETPPFACKRRGCVRRYSAGRRHSRTNTVAGESAALFHRRLCDSGIGKIRPRCKGHGGRVYR